MQEGRHGQKDWQPEITKEEIYLIYMDGWGAVRVWMQKMEVQTEIALCHESFDQQTTLMTVLPKSSRQLRIKTEQKKASNGVTS